MNIEHFPVLKEEVINYLNLKKGGFYIDATCGRGGHSKMILGSNKDIFLYGIDKDPEAVKEVSEQLFEFKNFKAIHSGFENIDTIFQEENIPHLDGVLFDIGFSTNQIKNSKRGFSFQMEGPLDMRYDTNNPLTAWEIINKWDKNNLIWIFEKYGEIKNSKKLVDAIIKQRRIEKFETTTSLANFISSYYGYRKKIHPATKVFMSLRIAVNDELNALATGLRKTELLLNTKGRIVVISFHSLEDRIVKNFLKNCSNITPLTKKPIVANVEEISLNPESRCAKLRVGEKK